MYRKQVRRRRAVLVLLVVASLVLISIFFSEGSSGPLHGIQRGVATIFGPIEEGASRALKPARDLFSWVDETFEARGENERLQGSNRELRDRLAEAEAALDENRRLRKLIGLARRGGLGGFEPVTARVIGRSPTVWYSTATIDVGSSAGVEEDDPVITGDGLIGRINEVTRGTAQVRLITDHRSSVSAKVLPDGPSGVVGPEVGDPDDLLLEFIEGDKEVKKGATLVTAGWTSGQLRSRFPFGLRIGEVSETSIGEQETFERVHVTPFADIRELELVQVLTGPGGGE